MCYQIVTLAAILPMGNNDIYITAFLYMQYSYPLGSPFMTSERIGTRLCGGVTNLYFCNTAVYRNGAYKIELYCGLWHYSDLYYYWGVWDMTPRWQIESVCYHGDEQRAYGARFWDFYSSKAYDPGSRKNRRMRVRERFTRQNGGFDDYGFIVFFVKNTWHTRRFVLWGAKVNHG